MATTQTIKGFIQNWEGQRILPITRAELVLDQNGKQALTSGLFEAGKNGNEFGLISAAALALLQGGSNGQGISDIYSKLDSINSGLVFNDRVLNFYNTNGVATPIQINANSDNGINLGIAGNVISLSLNELSTNGTTITQFIKSITVDKYGRVTSVSGSAITDEEIPPTLTGKTLVNGVLNRCTTSGVEVADDELAVVNKAYVDAKFQAANGVATGALKFGGSVSTSLAASNALTNSDNYNSYYKVTGNDVVIPVSDLYETTGLQIQANQYYAKAGDTLIVYPPQEGESKATFICIPSADDYTRITVTREGDSSVITSKDRDVYFQFSKLFQVSDVNNSGNTAIISMLPASASQDGYLSATDFNRFNEYSQKLAVSYVGNLSQGDGIYEIGKLTIGENTHSIYGKNSVSNLSFGTVSGNPTLQFTETYADDVNIAIKGVNGIITRANGNDLEIAAAIEVDVDSANYLTVENGYKLKVKIGDKENQTKHALTDYKEFSEFRSQIATYGVAFEEISNSLTETSNDYYYGSSLLIEAVDVTI